MMEKKGFLRFGYIENFKEYHKKIKELAGPVSYNYSEFDESIDARWNDKEKYVRCYNRSLEMVLSSSEDIYMFMIDIGYYKQDSKEPLYACFYRKEPAKINAPGWTGVRIGTAEDLMGCVKGYAYKLEAYTTGIDYVQIARRLSDITGELYNIDTCRRLLQQSYELARDNGSLAVVENKNISEKRVSFFPLNGCMSKNKEKLFITMEKNKYNGRHEWYGAFVTTQNELKEDLVSYYVFHVGRFVFDSMQSSNEFFDSLARKAAREKWSWNDESRNAGYNNPILKSYLEFTYYRLLDEDAALGDDKFKNKKIVEYEGKCYFNSGLLDKLFRQIIIVGDVYNLKEELPGLGTCSWNLIKNLKAYSHNDAQIAKNFKENELPGIASYFEDYRQIVFDASLDIHFNDNHIFEDGVARGRLPKYQKEYERVKENEVEKEELLRRIARDFDSACDRAKLLAERNYKLAVPQFWKETGEIQFLLPIYLGEREESEKPQCALVLSLDDSGRCPYYRGETILTLDMAYNNTRLIAKPDVSWLNE